MLSGSFVGYTNSGDEMIRIGTEVYRNGYQVIPEEELCMQFSMDDQDSISDIYDNEIEYFQQDTPNEIRYIDGGELVPVDFDE